MPQITPSTLGTAKVPQARQKAKSLTQTTVKPRQEILEISCEETVSFEEWLVNLQVQSATNHQKDQERKVRAKKGSGLCQ